METSVINRRKQRGVALAIALIMFVMMLLGGLYVMKAGTMATIVTGNLAYQRDLSRAADIGVEVGFDWLKATSVANKPLLDDDSTANGYLSSYNPSLDWRDAAFWTGSVTTAGVDGTGKSIAVEYVIHRMCLYPNRPYTDNAVPIQACVQTAPQVASNTSGAKVGDSLSGDADAFSAGILIHYVITARYAGAKGASAANQLVVMIGA